MCDIHAARVTAQRQHKLSLLEDARSGDRNAIAHLRRSASQTFFEGSFTERLGGQHTAVESMKAFYARKYSQSPDEGEVTPAQIAALKAKHSVPADPITAEEVSDALARSRPNTSSGIDAACNTAITYHCRGSF